MANPFGRSVVLPLTNQSGGSVAAGDFVYLDTGHNDSFTTGTTSAYTGAIGVAQQAIGAGSVGLVLVQGYASLVNVNASVTRGNFGKGYTSVKQATDAGASRVTGTFCQFLTGGTTPDAMIWQPDLGAGSGLSDPMTTRGDIIVRNASNVTARLGIGSSGKYLKSDGTDISWQTVTAGVTHSYLGYNTIGGTGFSVNNNWIFWKQITPASDGLITGIGTYFQWQEDFLYSLAVMVASDNSGAPNLIQAVNSVGNGTASSTGVDISGASGTAFTARWLTLPITYWATGSTPIWIGIQINRSAGGGSQPKMFKDTSGTDVITKPGGFYQGDPIWANSGTITTTTDKHSIRADFVV